MVILIGANGPGIRCHLWNCDAVFP